MRREHNAGMNREELGRPAEPARMVRRRVQGGSRTAVPRSAYEAPFRPSPTPAGGMIVSALRERDGEVDVVGVDEVDKVQNEFLSAIRSGQMFSREIEVGCGRWSRWMERSLLAFLGSRVTLGASKPVYLRRGPAPHLRPPRRLQRAVPSEPSWSASSGTRPRTATTVPDHRPS